jgi:hypothetical protein
MPKTVKLPPMSEKAFTTTVINLATMLGWRHYHTHDSRRSDPGWPDLVLARKIPAAKLILADLVFAELKTETGKVTPAQADWLEMLRLAGQRVYIWRPSDLERIAEILR